MRPLHGHRATGLVDVPGPRGPRVYVDRIDIVGNTRTLDYVVRREMNVAEGDAYNRVLVDRSKNQIRALGFFKDVDITEVPGSAPDRTALQVKVEEQPTGELSFSAGYSSVDQLVLDLGITQRNFRGRGQECAPGSRWGHCASRSTSFTDPDSSGAIFGRLHAYTTATLPGNLPTRPRPSAACASPPAQPEFVRLAELYPRATLRLTSRSAFPET